MRSSAPLVGHEKRGTRASASAIVGAMHRLALIALCLSVPTFARADCDYQLAADVDTRRVTALTDDTVLIRARYIYTNQNQPPQLFTLDRAGKVTVVKAPPKPERDATLQLARDAKANATGKASLCRAGSCASLTFPVTEGKLT